MPLLPTLPALEHITAELTPEAIHQGLQALGLRLDKLESEAFLNKARNSLLGELYSRRLGRAFQGVAENSHRLYLPCGKPVLQKGVGSGYSLIRRYRPALSNEILPVGFNKVTAHKIVGQQKWEKILPGEIGETVGLGPCTGILVYDVKKQSAAICHLFDPTTGRELDEMTNYITENFSIQDRVLFVAGLEIDPHFRQHGLERRNWLKSYLTKHFPDTPQLMLFNPGSVGMGMRIDTRSGTIEVEMDYY